jgi:predicted permease
MSRANPIEALRGVGRSTADKSALSRQGLVILQVAVSLVLLVGAGLLTTSLYRLQHQDFGFQTSGRLMVSVNPVVAGYKPDRLPGLYDRLQDQLSRVPGVERVSLSQYSPMEGMNWSGAVSVEGRPIDPGRHDSASWLRVGAHYFETVGTRLVRGRPIDERDTPGSTHVTVVSERFAREFFGEADPIGRHLGFGEDPAHTMDYEVVGVVEDAKYVRAAEPGWAMYFLPLLQAVTYRSDSLMSMQTRSMFINDIVLRVTDGSPNLEAEVRRAIAAVDPNLPVTSVVSFEEQLDRNFNQQRLVARLTTLYGQLALLLAMVGLYGITAQSVTRRTGEIGLRMALGADRRRVLGMVLGRAMTQTLIGLSIGVPVALGAGGLLAGQLYGVSGHDAFVLGGSILVLAACAIGAAFVPARRAATLDPVTALRGD